MGKDFAGKQCQHANPVVSQAAMKAGSVERKQVEQGPVGPRPEWIDNSPTVRRVGSHVEIHRFTISDIIVRGYAGKKPAGELDRRVLGRRTDGGGRGGLRHLV